MARIRNTFGGGARTNANGLLFEQDTSLDNALINAGYSIDNHYVYYNNTLLGLSVPQHKLYSCFLEPNDIRYEEYNSKEWRPDECFINLENKIAFIIEKKFQNCRGSVDEKLPSCHFKKQEYEKLFSPLDYQVEFIYVLSAWFMRPEYEDTLEYILQMGCFYYFNSIPLDALGL